MEGVGLIVDNEQKIKTQITDREHMINREQMKDKRKGINIKQRINSKLKINEIKR